MDIIVIDKAEHIIIETTRRTREGKKACSGECIIKISSEFIEFTACRMDRTIANGDEENTAIGIIERAADPEKEKASKEVKA